MPISYTDRISNWNYIFILFFIWLVMVALVNPIGNFPLGDDWSYARSVENLIKYGELEFTGWTFSPLLAHTLWGSLFSLIFGFSFTTLRFSILILGFAGALGVNEFFKEAGIKPMGAFLASLLVIINPFYFQLSNSFALEISLFTFSVWSILFYIKTYRTGRRRDFILAILFNVLAALVQDYAVILPLAFALGLGITRKVNKKILIFSGISILTIGIVYFGWRILLDKIQGLPVMYDEGSRFMVTSAAGGFSGLFKAVFKNLFFAIFFICFYSLPALFAGVNLKVLQKREVFIPAVVFIIISAMLIHFLPEMSGNVSRYILETALWPYYPEASQAKQLNSVLVFPDWLKTTVTYLAFLSTFLVFLRLGELYVRKDKRRSFTFSKAMSIGIIALFIIPDLFSGIFNRNLIFILPFALLLIINEDKINLRRKFSLAPTIAVLVVFMYLSVSNARDWLYINRIKWDVLNFVVLDADITPAEVDGGFEFNGWNNYDENYIKREGKNWWWVYDDIFVVSHYVPEEYEQLNKFEYNRWFLPGYKGKIYLSGRRRPDERLVPDNLALHEDKSVLGI